MAQLVCLTAFMPWAHAHTLRFVLHLLVCAGFGKSSAEAGFVPVPYAFIWQYFRNAAREKDRLIDEGLIEVVPHSRTRRRCAEYRVCLPLQVAFAEAGLTQDYRFAEEAVNLVTGRPTTRRTRSLLKDEHNHRFPPLIHAAITSVGPGLFNMGAIRRHLVWKKARIAEASPGKAQDKARRQYEVDLRCFEALSGQGPPRAVDADDPDGLYVYAPAYRPQRFGRISQIGGGLQSCSKEMKARAYSGVPSFKNYDLRASQPTLLIVLLGEAGVDASWLKAYAAFGKVAAAARVGVTVETWKTLLCALLMGAWTPSEAQAVYRPRSRKVGIKKGGAHGSGRAQWTFPYSRGAITDTILEAVGDDQFASTYRRFLVYTAALRASLREWHLWLGSTFVATCGWRNPADGKTYLTNAVGARVAVEDLSGSAFTRRSQLAAFQLQGREAALIHTLVSLSGSYGFTVLAHEHDGLAVQGCIPETAIQEASKKSVIPVDDVILEEKSFT